jgi:hypothetical protein
MELLMATLQQPPTQQLTGLGSFVDWIYKAWQAIVGVQTATTNITFSAGPPPTTTVTGDLDVTGDVTVGGIVTDAETYTRNLGIYTGLLSV